MVSRSNKRQRRAGSEQESPPREETQTDQQHVEQPPQQEEAESAAPPTTQPLLPNLPPDPSTLVALDLLVPVPPVDQREFLDWGALQAYVGAYAQRTHQLYTVQSVVSVEMRNAQAQTAGDSVMVPNTLVNFSLSFGCVHGWGPHHAMANQQTAPAWSNTNCPAQIKASVTKSWNGAWVVVIAQQFAFHNHYVNTVFLQPQPPAGSSTLGGMPDTGQPMPVIPLGMEASAAASNNAAQSVSQSPEDPTDIVRLNRVISVPVMQELSFEDWDAFSSYLASYSHRTFQNYSVAIIISAKTRNRNIRKAQSTSHDLLVPDQFRYYSRTFRCIHAEPHQRGNIGRRKRARITNCPAQIKACLKRDDETGEWRVAIAQQVPVHNHHVNALVYARFARSNRWVTDETFLDASGSLLLNDIEPAYELQRQTAALGQRAIANPNSSLAQVHANAEIAAASSTVANEATSDIVQLDRLVPVPVMQQRTFSGWDAFNSYVALYGRRTFQRYLVAIAVSTTVRNRGDREKRADQLIPDSYKFYSKTVRCVHAAPRFKADTRVQRSTNCPAQIKANVERDPESGEWHVTVVKQVAFHNHDVSASLYKRFARKSKWLVDETQVEGAETLPTAENVDEEDEDDTNMPVVQLEELVRAPSMEHQSFADWDEFNAFIASYSRQSFQRYLMTVVLSVKARNTFLLKSPATTPEQLIPERFATFSRWIRCIHSEPRQKKSIGRKRRARCTNCPAEIKASVKKDDNTGEWRVIISRQIPFHNHELSASLYKRFARKNERDSADTLLEAAEALHHIDADRPRHDDQGSSHSLAQSVVWESRAALSDQHLIQTTTDESRGLEVPTFFDNDQVDSGDDATEVVQLDRLISVPSMQQRVFSDWDALKTYMAAYCESTCQLFSIISAVRVSARNEQLLKAKKPKTNRLVPEEFGFFKKFYRCIHGGTPPANATNMEPNANRQRSRKIQCPAQISVLVKREGEFGDWQVIVMQQQALHNHRLSKSLYRRYATEKHSVTNPAVLSGVMSLHHRGAQSKQIAEYIRKHSGFEPSTKYVNNLVAKMLESQGPAATGQSTMDREQYDQQRYSSHNEHADSNEYSNYNRYQFHPSEARSYAPRGGNQQQRSERPQVDPEFLNSIKNLVHGGANRQELLDFIHAQEFM